MFEQFTLRLHSEGWCPIVNVVMSIHDADDSCVDGQLGALEAGEVVAVQRRPLDGRDLEGVDESVRFGVDGADAVVVVDDAAGVGTVRRASRTPVVAMPQDLVVANNGSSYGNAWTGTAGGEQVAQV